MCVGLAVTQLNHSGLYGYPKHGQSADQQSRDAGQCNHSSALGLSPARVFELPEALLTMKLRMGV